MKGEFDEETVSSVAAAFFMFQAGERAEDVVHILHQDQMLCRTLKTQSPLLEIIHANDGSWRMSR